MLTSASHSLWHRLCRIILTLASHSSWHRLRIIWTLYWNNIKRTKKIMPTWPSKSFKIPSKLLPNPFPNPFQHDMQSNMKHMWNYIRIISKNLSKTFPKTYPKTSPKPLQKPLQKHLQKPLQKPLQNRPPKIPKIIKKHVIFIDFWWFLGGALEATWSDIGTGSASSGWYCRAL